MKILENLNIITREFNKKIPPEIYDALRNGESMTLLLPEKIRAFFLAWLSDASNKTILMLTHSPEKIPHIIDDVSSFIPLSNILFFPDWEILPGESISPDIEIIGQRARVFNLLEKNKKTVIISTVESSLQNLPFSISSRHTPLQISENKEIDPYHLMQNLINYGYKSTYQISDIGEAAKRGGIIDIFSSTALYPVRLEFDGDKVTSIRQFSITDQKSFNKISELDIWPAREFELTDDICLTAKRFLQKNIPDEDITEDLARLAEGISFNGYERYYPWLSRSELCLLDLLDSESMLVFDEPEKIESRFHKIIETASRMMPLNPALNKFEAVPYYQEFSRLNNSNLQKAAFTLLRSDEKNNVFSLKSAPIGVETGHSEKIEQYLKHNLNDKGIIISANDYSRLERLHELMEEWLINPARSSKKIPKPGQIFLASSSLHMGFILDNLSLLVITDEDIFGQKIQPKVSQKAQFSQEKIKRLPFSPGNYVVHEDYGIALFDSVCQQEIDNFQRDYLLLHFAGKDRLYVPVEQMEKITRYIGSDQSSPKLNYLGSSHWPLLKKKARSSVKKMAIDLLKLYASRTQAKGQIFSKDSPWQKELEDSFPYRETPDQDSAINQTKKDMELPKPMDRLICGDVGYGKTEVALRATFKAVYDGKQVLFLAPTTILAQQHFQTFKERLSPFPVNIEVLSRFRTKKEQKEIVNKLNLNELDVVIGTHRLLQNDIQPKDLGLLIIDEEQRFGVKHKEHFRHLREKIDVITMTATPIPRTLQMSLSGIRDISIINTPPEERLPIQTYVGRYRSDIARSAIYRELERGGQVFYLYNKVFNINKIVRKVKSLAPDARIGLAHGQMPESHLEKSMLDFQKGEYDILVCTTIIESGIDIPRANTIIIEEAERFGLAQLYQLRGRVGRSSHRAYSYLFYNTPANLTTTATERLTTIGELTELSSGMNIALKDLEIRGAGNLLGAEQHGNIASVGFDLYCKLLKEEVTRLKGEQQYLKGDAQIDLPVDLHIPDDYINQTNLRLEIYQKIGLVSSKQDIKEIENELTDRFGPLPKDVKNLIEIGYLRNLAQKAGLDMVSWRKDKIYLTPVIKYIVDNLNLDNLYYRYREDDQTLIINLKFNHQNLLFLSKMINDIIHRLISGKE